VGRVRLEETKCDANRGYRRVSSLDHDNMVHWGQHYNRSHTISIVLISLELISLENNSSKYDDDCE
jgi:hypothetical protein